MDNVNSVFDEERNVFREMIGFVLTTILCVLVVVLGVLVLVY